jgi:hypothetical protein
MGGLVVTEIGMIVVEVIVIDWDVLSKRMPATKHLMMEPEHLNSLWRR